REQDALCLVIRDFTNPAVEGAPDPLRDLESFHLECLFADLEVIERRLNRARKEPMSKQDQAAFEKMKEWLDDGRPIRSLAASELDRSALKSYAFLTDRPLLVALNRD